MECMGHDMVDRVPPELDLIGTVGKNINGDGNPPHGFIETYELAISRTSFAERLAFAQPG